MAELTTMRLGYEIGACAAILDKMDSVVSPTVCNARKRSAPVEIAVHLM